MSETKDSPRIILFAVCAAQFFMPFMVAGVNSILPAIGHSTGASAQELSLITTFYILGLVVAQLIAGRMGDIWGRRKVFLCGSAVFIAANFCIGFIDNIYYMMVLRTLQGLGAAIFSATGLSILAVAAPQGKRNQYIAYSATAIYVGIACGPPLAGFIGGSLGWQWLFWSTGAAAFCTWLFMRFAVHEEWYEGKGEPFNWVNASIYAVGMALVTFGSTVLKDSIWGGSGLIGLGIVVVAFYIWKEMHSQYHLLDVRLLMQNKVFALSSLAAFINYSAVFGMVIFFSLYLQVVLGISVEKAGLYLSWQFVLQALTSTRSGVLAARYGGGRVSAVGIAVCGLGLCISAFLDRESSLAFFFLSQSALGIGIGLFAAPNTSVILESVDKAHIGQAASVVGSMRTTGALVNTSIVTITFGYFLGDSPVHAGNIDAFLQSMQVDLLLFGVLNILAIAFALSREKYAT